MSPSSGGTRVSPVEERWDKGTRAVPAIAIHHFQGDMGPPLHWFLGGQGAVYRVHAHPSYGVSFRTSSLSFRKAPTATVKSIDPDAFMDPAASDYVLAVRVRHAGSIVMAHAVGSWVNKGKRKGPGRYTLAPSCLTLVAARMEAKYWMGGGVSPASKATIGGEVKNSSPC
jgi:hypothetical protein